MGFRFIMPLLANIFVFSTMASACPDNLRQLHTTHLRGMDLCQLHDRYQELQRQLEERGLKPATRIGNIMAPRFINLPDWLAKRNNANSRAWTVYNPAPLTWGNWEKTARIVDQSARDNFRSGTIPPITIDWFNNIQGIALNSLTWNPGQFRFGNELGMAIKRSTALTREQVKGVTEVSFPSVLRPGEGLTKFKPTICYEDQPESFQKAYTFSYGSNDPFSLDDWKPVDANTFFRDEDGQYKQCGFIYYAPRDELIPQLDLWLAYVNQAIKSLESKSPEADPILIASRIQRWFVAIHPYSSGNGRTSRFVMDWVFESLGLPTPVLLNMNYDLYSTEEDWANQVGDGLLRTIGEAEACLQDTNKPGCQVISEMPPPVTVNEVSK